MKCYSLREALSILDTRRKPQVYLADAVSDAGIMDIECCFLF